MVFDSFWSAIGYIYQQVNIAFMGFWVGLFIFGGIFALFITYFFKTWDLLAAKVKDTWYHRRERKRHRAQLKAQQAP